MMAPRVIALKRRRDLIERAHRRRHATAFAVVGPPPMPTPQLPARASAINPDFPIYGTPTTVTVRNNFDAAKTEIEDLQAAKLDLSGGMMTGPIVFAPNQVIDGGSF